METDISIPGQNLRIEKMPGHWLLAQMGKRVLRPGGIELTHAMLDALDLHPTDHVVEFAPGLGVTAQRTLAIPPASYTAVEADEAAAHTVRRYLTGNDQCCVVGKAEDTGLSGESATVVYGEAMLSMQTPGKKDRIVREAHRLLRPGGRYGIHELALVPDDLDPAAKDTISKALSGAIHVGARPLTISEWKARLTEVGFTVTTEAVAPMHLLELPRVLRDEGLAGTARIAWNVLRTPAARRRIMEMRRVFRHYDHHLAAVMLVARKDDTHGSPMDILRP